MQRGSYHDRILTETALERLHLGGQIKQLSLPNLISLAGFLANARITGELATFTRLPCLIKKIIVICFLGQLESLAEKVAENVGRELSMMVDDASCQLSDVRMIMQAWIHLASFNIFDVGRIQAIIEEVNMMHSQDFDEPSDIVSMEKQRAILGHKLGTHNLSTKSHS